MPLWVWGAQGAPHTPERIEGARKERDLLCSFPTLWTVLGGWKLEANRGGLGMLRAACVLVSGERGDPSSGLGRGLPFSAGASQPSPAPGPGSGGRAGNRRFRETVAFPAPARGPFTLQLCSAVLLQ